MTVDETRRSIGARRNPASADAIREAAAAVLAEAGHAGFSIEAVAKRARAGKPTIYRWWPNKTALLLDAYQRQKGDLCDPDTGNLEEDLALFLGNLLRLWRETISGPIFRSLIAEAQSDPTTAAALTAYAEERVASHMAIVERAKARGEVAADADSRAIIDTVVSYAWVRLLTDRLDVGDAGIRAVVQPLAKGLAPNPPMPR